MKIGILTFWWSRDNYGQAMQCYALQKFLSELGYEVFLIKYRPVKAARKSPLWLKILKAMNIFILVRYLMNKRNKNIIGKLKESQYAPRCFEDFYNNYIHTTNLIYSSPSEIKNNPPEADVYIVGSDQVWNPSLYEQRHQEIYFLNFGSEKTLRMSYAASWSVSSLSEESINIIKPLLEKFNYVSVREESGIELCKTCGYNNAEWVPDPTMLLSADVYRNIYKENKIRKIEKPYVLLYMLNNTCDFDIQNVYNFAKGKNLDVIYVTGNCVLDEKDKYFATIPEWLWLIDNAEYVITNSFHCCVFSTIFNKLYGVTKLNGKWEGSNSRFDSLFARYGIESRYISNNDFSILEKDYKKKNISVPFKFIKTIENMI